MKYNSPYSTAAWGQQAKDWEQGIDYSRMSKEQLARAQAAIKFAGLGAVLCFNFDNIRYVTSTHIGEWARDKFFRYALCPAEGKPFLWDPAPPAKRLSSPWIRDNVAAPITTMQGAIPPGLNVHHRLSPGRSRRRSFTTASTRNRSASTSWSSTCSGLSKKRASWWSMASRRCSMRARSRRRMKSSS